MAKTAQADAAVIVVWEPQSHPQAALIACPVFEAFFGGARGSLKTDSVLGDWINHASLYGKNAIGLMVRRTREELSETYERAKVVFTPLGFKFNDSKHVCTSSDGARLTFAYLDKDQDANRYQGWSLTRVYVEEIGNFPNPAPVMKLMATLRSAEGVPCCFRATGNPGGPGHQWVKTRYIDPDPKGWNIQRYEYANPFNGLTTVRERVFIPGKITDHNLLGDEYIANLQMSGSESLVKAWLLGDWDVVEGAFFDCWDRERHVIEPVTLPEHWFRYRAADWGSARPFSVGWYAVASETWKHPSGPIIPRGALVRYREWYGMAEGQPNTGVKMFAEEVAAGIVSRETKGENVADGVLDPSAFAQDGGPSIAERMTVPSDKKAGKSGLFWRPADNKRVATQGRMGGWDQVRARLVGEDGRPRVYIFSTGVHLIRTLPALQHDENRPEDVDTESEDHACLAAGTMVDGLGPIETVGTMTRCDTAVVRVIFDDGRAVVCTPDHLFLGDDGQWRMAKDLQSIRLCSATRRKNFLVLDITSAGCIFSARALDCIAWFGSTVTELSHKVSTFITKTTTVPTIGSPIFGCYPSSVIFPSMARAAGFPQPLGLRRQNGTGARRGESGIPSIGGASLPRLWRKLSRSLARSAGKLSRLAASRRLGRGFATKTAKPVRCVRVERLSERQDVYCMGTKEGLLIVQGGLIVSNCDEFRYACMARPYIRPKPGKPAPVWDYVTKDGETILGNVPIRKLIERQERRLRDA